MSLIASYVSSIALIGVPAEAYYFGISVVFIAIAQFVASLVAAWLFVPLFHPLGITSVQEVSGIYFVSYID